MTAHHGIMHAVHAASPAIGGLIALAIVLTIMAAGMLPAIVPILIQSRKGKNR